MPYVYTCDGCNDRYDTFPPFAGEFTETFLKTTDTGLADKYNPGQKVTLCPDCITDLVL